MLVSKPKGFRARYEERAMYARRLQTDDSFQSSTVKMGQRHKIQSIDRGLHQAQKSLEDSLSGALQAADSEFGNILHEVEEISRILKSDNPDKQILKVAAHPAVWTAVKQALLDRELRYLALTDDLTCLYNRRGFFAAASQLLKLASRNSQRVLLLFCDVDNLKQINDTFGHHEGDLALMRTADAFEHTFRNSDVLGRLGGDEFAVLAVETSSQGYQVILRRIEQNLKEANAGESRYELSVSVGAAWFDPEHPISLGELMVEADKAMYEMKGGRKSSNQSCSSAGSSN
jgi:diguanylate cyclase (GGDEF)-like protein